MSYELSNKTSIVIVEDDVKLADLIVEYLTNNGFKLAHATDGESGLNLVQTVQPDLVILDLNLPKMDGLTVCRKLNQSSFNGKILFLTTSEDDFDHVAALEAGSDDFFPKPIQPRVLLARIRALLRREPSFQQTTLIPLELGQIFELNDLKLHLGRSQVWLNENEIFLTEAEFELLSLLATKPDHVFSREAISLSLRGLNYDGIGRGIDNRILTLRKKLGDNTSMPKRILTIRGKGYLLASTIGPY